VPRQRPPQRLDELMSAATRVFSAMGYRRAQMADVARELGVSAGTLYLYAESKEALFDLVVRHGLDDDAVVPADIALPVRTPAPGATLAHLRSAIDQAAHWPLLDAALRGRAAKGVEPELTAILSELAGSMRRHRWGLILLSRSALDWPELATVFLGGLRKRILDDLEAYLRRRIKTDKLRAVPDPAIAAIFINETLAFWVLHRLGDPGYAAIPDDVAERIAVDMLVHALLGRP
jgi:AcrR family transcriptional regulator